VEVKTEPSTLLGVNTLLSNVLVAEAIENGVITELQGYDALQREVRYGTENSRIDILLQHHERTPCYVEVKNVTLVQGSTAFFPDAVTKRGSKHLRELAYMAQQGCRALIFFCVQRGDVNEVRPAQHIDAQYAQTLRQVLQQGVEALAYSAEVNPQGITLTERVPVVVE
jgi:sugar fermentation stimulation protein A